MSIKPILFNEDMVRAILDGRKTATRRKIDVDISNRFDVEIDGKVICYIDQATGDSYKPTELCRYQPGDILYVRETWCKGSFDVEELPDGRTGETFVEQRIGDNDYIFKEFCLRNKIWIDEVTWKPSIHMPKEAARIWLKVTNVRVERLQDITHTQAESEGVGSLFFEDIAFGKERYNIPYIQEEGLSRHQFAYLWDSTIKKPDINRYGWDANPWVWVIEFERCEKPEEVSH